MPAGRYTLTASVGELVGSREDVIAQSGTTRQVEIRLGPSASIGGAPHAPTSEVSVSATPSGMSADAIAGEVAEDEFEVAGLVPNRRYDLTFSAPTLRKVTLRDVVAPTAGLDVSRWD